MKRFLVCVAALLCAAPVFATTPQPLPANLPPLRVPVVPQLPRLPKVGPPVSAIGWTPELIRGLGLSSTVTHDLLLHLFPGSHGVVSSTSEDPGNQLASPTPSMRRLRLETNTTLVGTVQADSDANQDIEPSIITNRYTENGQTIDRTTSVFTKFSAAGVPSHYWTSASSTNFTSGGFTGWPTGTQLSIPAPANRSSDPMLSENPYSSCSGCPIANPKRTYAVGVAYDLNGPGGNTGDTMLVVWYTDHVADPSYPWTPMVVNQGYNPLFLDKPSIWTSWDQTHGTLGYTYIVCVLAHLDTNYHDIQVYRQTTATHFDLVYTFQNLNVTVTSPIVTVDSNTGDVYVLWIDNANGTISIARSTTMGNSFATPVAFTAQNTMPPDGCNNVIYGTAGARVQAVTSLMARPNATDNSIGVAWHLHEADGQHTDLGFNRFQISTQSWTNFRGRPLGHVTADLHDQWNPALDAASDGTYMTTWYDKRNDPNNNTYQLYACRIAADGTPIDATDTLVYNNAAAANPASLPAFADPSCGLGATRRYMGEYQDLWEWYGTWYGATIYITNNQDLYVTRLTP